MELTSALTIFLCTILVYSSIAKAVGYEGFRETVRQLKYPAFLAAVVIGAELVIAALLLFEATYLVGAIGALLLFLSFYYVASRAIWKKMKVACNCFGKSTEEELGWRTIVKITPLFMASIVCISSQSPIQLSDILPIELISTVGLTVGMLNLYALWNNRALIAGGKQE